MTYLFLFHIRTSIARTGALTQCYLKICKGPNLWSFSKEEKLTYIQIIIFVMKVVQEAKEYTLVGTGNKNNIKYSNNQVFMSSLNLINFIMSLSKRHNDPYKMWSNKPRPLDHLFIPKLICVLLLCVIQGIINMNRPKLLVKLIFPLKT